MGAACEHHHPDSGLHGGGLIAALDAAEGACRAAGERMTTPRRRVLELLLQAGEPVKAYDLIAAFNDAPDGEGGVAKPPTVYRALDFLSRMGLAHRIASISAYVACIHADADHSAAFLICDCCGTTREVAMPRSGLEASARDAGFALGHVTVEGHGRCEACGV
ncbi:Fur family transcriptional regulator [Brevundimonas sp.]|uniref:Fur family transcriptional regulator n=1 Tax=Brevundimonas sp. TaxID=1871086 RepID=UPI0035B17253